MRMSRQARWIVAGAAALVVVLVVVGVVLLSGGKRQPAAAPAADLRSEPAVTSTSAPVTTIQPTTTTTTVPSTVKTTTTRKPATKTTMPAPTPHPVDIPVPPPPHPAPVPGCAPTFSGPNAPKADVKAALLAAAGKQYWVGVSNPPMIYPPGDGGPSTPPPQRAVITVPATLIQAIAWQESGWQSAIKACDGGVGTMQIMDATASWMNQRFGTSYNHTTLAGNTAIGAEYLEWLIAYFGENNFDHHYDITDPDLLTAVIVGYNAGPGAVRFADGHTVTTHYATTVKALMQSQPWGA